MASTTTTTTTTTVVTTTTTGAAAGKMTLNYWGGRGLMEIARQMLAIAGKFPSNGGYTNVMGKQPEGDMAANLGRMPTCETSAGAIGQSTAIYYYVAVETGLFGANTFEGAQCLAVLSHVKELMEEYRKLVPWGKLPDEETANKWFTAGASETSGPAQGRGERYMKWWMGRIEAALTGTDGFAVGNKISLADVVLYNTFMEFLTAEEAPAKTMGGDDFVDGHRYPFASLERTNAALAAHPKIKASCEKVANHPNIKKWLAERGPQGF